MQSPVIYVTRALVTRITGSEDSSFFALIPLGFSVTPRDIESSYERPVPGMKWPSRYLVASNSFRDRHSPSWATSRSFL